MIKVLLKWEERGKKIYWGENVWKLGATSFLVVKFN